MVYQCADGKTQVFVIVYQADTTPSRAGLIFNKFGAYFTYGCLVPLVVSFILIPRF